MPEFPDAELEKPPARANATRATTTSEIAPDETTTALSRGVRRRRWIARDRDGRSDVRDDGLRVDDGLRIAVPG